MNKSIFFLTAFIIAIGVAVSLIKYEVAFMRKRLKNIQSEIEKYQENLKVLEAEWSYLNNPERLSKLCKKYLPNMKPIEPKQIISYNKFSSLECKNKAIDLNSLIDKAIKNSRYK